MADTFDLLGSLAKVSGGAVQIDVSNPLVIDLGEKWISRSISVGIATQARSNLTKGQTPNGDPMPPLKSQDSISVRSLERTSKLRGKAAKVGKHLRGIDTGLLMRSIVSRSVGNSAEVYVKGERGMAHGDDPPASVTTFVPSSGNVFYVDDLTQPKIAAALNKVAQRVVDQKVQADMEDVMDMLH